MSKPPARSATHQEVDPMRLAALGLELEELAQDGQVPLPELVALAEDRGKPASHYLAALALCDELALASRPGGVQVRVCAGACQRWGALELLEHLVMRSDRDATLQLVPVSCLDRCDRAAACRIDGPAGTLFVDEASPHALDEALAAVTP